MILNNVVGQNVTVIDCPNSGYNGNPAVAVILVTQPFKIKIKNRPVASLKRLNSTNSIEFKDKKRLIFHQNLSFGKSSNRN